MGADHRRVAGGLGRVPGGRRPIERGRQDGRKNQESAGYGVWPVLARDSREELRLVRCAREAALYVLLRRQQRVHGLQRRLLILNAHLLSARTALCRGGASFRQPLFSAAPSSLCTGDRHLSPRRNAWVSKK